MSSTKIEFAVHMTCESCVDAVKNSVKDVPGINSLDINLETNSVVIDTNLPTLDVQNRLEKSGRKVVVRGYAGSVAGVSILQSLQKKVQGVIRFVQATPDTCIIDGTIDGLSPGIYEAAIHECGDISQGCENVGEVYNPDNYAKRKYGEIGKVTADINGRATFRLENDTVKLSDIIGRSFVISENSDSQKSNKFACGVIARSAGLFQNPKTICACDGLTIWNEKIPPKSPL